MKTTIREVALLAGVSPSTASTALSGRKNGIGVSAATQVRVREAATALKWSPPGATNDRSSNSASPPRQARIKRTTAGLVQTIGIICDYRHEDDFWLRVVLGAVESVLADAGAVSRVFELARKEQPACTLSEGIEALRAESVSGVIIVDIHGDIGHNGLLEACRSLDARTLPFVVITTREQAPLTPNILHDQRAAGTQAVLHLIERGHRVFTFFVPFDRHWEADRVAGARRALEIAGLPASSLSSWPLRQEEREEYDRSRSSGDPENYLRNSARDFVRHLAQEFADTPWPALIGGNDIAALAVMEAAAEIGKTAGRDYALIGFDEVPQARLKGLTTLQPPLQGMGEEAARLLLRLLDGKRANWEMRLRSQVIARASTLPLKSP